MWVTAKVLICFSRVLLPLAQKPQGAGNQRRHSERCHGQPTMSIARLESAFYNSKHIICISSVAHATWLCGPKNCHETAEVVGRQVLEGHPAVSLRPEMQSKKDAHNKTGEGGCRCANCTGRVLCVPQDSRSTASRVPGSVPGTATHTNQCIPSLHRYIRWYR
jgi:hypothetical protein